MPRSYCLSAIMLLSSYFMLTTGCGSHFRNPGVFNILKEPLLVQKQTLYLQKAHGLSYLELEG